MSVLLVFLGGMIGAPARFLTDRAVQNRWRGTFPWGTFTVNMTGSLILGFLAGGTHATVLPHNVSLLIGTGFCGALTTFSTLSFETWRLTEEGAYGLALRNAAGSLLLGLGAAAAGYALGAAL